MRDWSHWHLPEQLQLPESLRQWLLDHGSLTRRLQDSSQHKFAVDWLGSDWQRPLPEERRLLHLPLDQLAYQRQVRLLDGDQARVYARTVVPVATYLAHRQRFAALGNRPLGEMLFNDPEVRRGPIQVACLKPGQRLYELALIREADRPDSLWGRRSCFYLYGKVLLVNEVFLPAMWSEQRR